MKAREVSWALMDSRDFLKQKHHHFHAIKPAAPGVKELQTKPYKSALNLQQLYNKPVASLNNITILKSVKIDYQNRSTFTNRVFIHLSPKDAKPNGFKALPLSTR